MKVKPSTQRFTQYSITLTFESEEEVKHWIGLLDQPPTSNGVYEVFDTLTNLYPAIYKDWEGTKYGV